ncbi:MAG: flagellar hook-basal body complex protein FliE [Gammaproteobacteria bacterium]|nr:flagellar hook-basal body complex protein FliE [Gammaproteobacteria bacterium]
MSINTNLNTSYDVSGVLQEMRRLAQAAQGTALAQNGVPATGGGFSEVLGKAIGQVNKLQLEAGSLAQRVEMGDRSVNLAQAMVAGQKASVAFQAAVQVRNRVVQAYQDIMNMPI